MESAIRAKAPGPAGAKPAAEAAPKAASEPVGQPPGLQIQEAQPSVIHLRDKSGNLVPVPGYRLEDFEQMIKRDQLKQADPAPRYSLQSMQVTGTAKAGHAELTIQFRCLVHHEGWVRVPLRLDQAVLSGEPQYKGPGQQFVHLETGGEGYVSWVRGGAGKEHQLTLKVLVPLVTVGEETRLRLFAPRATSSEMKLTVPGADAAGEVSEGATLLPVAPAGQGGSVLTALGLGGDFELVWRKAAGRAAETQTALEATGAILAKVGGQGIDSEVRLNVRGHGAPFDSFRIRLPKGAELVPGSPAGYLLVPMASTGPVADEQKLLEVRLSKKTTGPLDIQFATRLSYDAAGPTGWCDLGSCEVVGAARHAGHIALVAEGQWQVVFGSLRGLRQVEELPSHLRRPNLVAGFEYFRQPCSLPVRVVQGKSRISVEPEYVLLVDADRVALQARLKYRIRTAEVGALDVELPGWQLEEIGPESAVVADAVMDQSGLVSIPLVQRVVGPLELTFRASRKIPAEARSLALDLPRPRGDWLAPATVVILPADNVELTPIAETTVGLARQQAAPPIKLPERQQAPLFYRSEPGRAVFAAGFRVHPQKIGTSATAQISLDDQRARVEQKLGYAIAHKPLERLTLEVPRGLSQPRQLEILLDGKPQTLVDPGDPEGRPNPSGPVRRQLLLPAPRIGSCEVVVRYTVDLDKLLPKTSIPATIPLVMPVDGVLASNNALVTARAGIRVQPRAGPWAVSDEPPLRQGQEQGVQLSAAERTGELALGVYMEDQATSGTTVVQRAWVQTWLAQSSRQDRAVFRLFSDQKTVELIVPAGVNPGDVELWLDGRTAKAQTTPEGRLIVPLSGDSLQSQHVLEAVYHFVGGRSDPGSMEIELPRLARNAWVHRMYWQLVLPRNEHLLATPASLSAESHWDWNGVLWGRKPVLEQPQLEAWCGARQLPDVPAEANRYLFSTAGTVGRCELRTAGRGLLVLVASGLVLVSGLVLIYVPASRHPATLLVVATLVASAVLLYPEPAFLAAQAGSFGVALVVLAGWLHWTVVGGHRRPVAHEISSASLQKGSMPSGDHVPGTGNESPTEEVPVVTQLPTPNSQT